MILINLHRENWADLKKAKALLRTGKGGKALPGQPLALRLFGHCIETPSGCWEYQGARHSYGYGLLNAGPNKYAHRAAYEHVHGSIPEGLFVCHRCDNPPCCNPAHLFVGTNSENMQDMSRKGRSRQQAKTHCPKGHPYDGDNLAADGRRAGLGRRCRACHRADGRRRYAAKRANVLPLPA